MSASPGRHHADEPTDPPPATSTRRRWHPRPVVAALFLTLLAGVIGLAAWAQAAGRPTAAQRTATLAVNSDARVTAVGDAVEGYLGILDTVDGYQTLKKGLPFGGGTFLDERYRQVFQSVDDVRTKVRALAANADLTLAQLDARLDDIDGNGDPANDGSVGGVTLDLDVDLTGDVSAASFQAVVTIGVTTLGSPDLTWRADGVTVNGRPAKGELGFHGSTTITVTPAAATKFAIKVDNTPTGVLRVGVKGEFRDSSSNPLAFKAGVLGVKGVGKVVADMGVKVTLVDPGTGAKDGVIDNRELGDLAKAFTVSCVSNGATANLTVSTDVVGLTTKIGSLGLTDATLCDGVSPPTVKLAELGDLRDLTVGDLVNGLAQVTRALQTAQDAGDIDLPFVTEGLSRVVQVNEKLVKFFVDNGLTDPAHPMDTITFDKDKPPFTTVQELTPKLAKALGLASGDLALQYVAPDAKGPASIRLVVKQNSDPAAKPDAGTIDFGDTFGRVGIGAVSGTAKATIDPKYSLDLGLGFSLGSGIKLEDRFFLTNRIDPKTGANLGIFTADAAVSAKLDLQGALPPVGVTVRTPGTVQLLAPVDASKPTLRVALLDPTDDGRVTLKDLATSFQGRQFPVAATVNARVPSFTLGATVDVLGTPAASGSLTVAWPNVTDPKQLAVTTDANFRDVALPFAFDTSDPKAAAVKVLTTARDAVKNLRESITQGSLSTTTPLPVIGKSAAEFEPTLAKLQTTLDDLVARADAVSLATIQQRVDRAAADAFGLPKDRPAPSVLTFSYQPAKAATQAALTARLTLSACTVGRGTCTVSAQPVVVPFNLPLAKSRSGGLAAADATGKLSVGYDVGATLVFGIELPRLVADGTGVKLDPNAPASAKVVRPFIGDDTAFTLGVGARFTGTMSAAFGPFTVGLGKPASGNVPADPAVAQVAARFQLGLKGAGAKLAPADFAARFLASLKTISSVRETRAGLTAGCGNPDAVVDACASLPVYLGGRSLGPIGFTAPNLLQPAGWTASFDQVEASLATRSVQFGLLVDGVRALSDQLERSLRALPAGTKIPLVGTDVLAGADAVKAFNEKVLGPVQALSGDLASLTSVNDIVAKAQAKLQSIAPKGSTVDVRVTCRTGTPGTSGACGPSATVDQLQSFEVRLPMELSVQGSKGFDFGFPGLSLTSGDSVVEGEAKLTATLAFGIDRDLGFYVPTDVADEFKVSAAVRLPATMQAELGFVPISVTNENPVSATDGRRAPDVAVGFALDLATSRADKRLPLQELGSATLTPTLTATTATRLRLRTEFGRDPRTGTPATSGMPKLSALFSLDAGLTWSPGRDVSTTASLGFTEVDVDLGELMTQYIKPAVAEIRKYTSPLEPAIDAITSPIPGVKEAMELVGEEPVAWYDVFKQFEGAIDPDQSGLQLVDRVIEFVRTVKALDEGSSASGTVRLGGFTLDGAKARNPLPVSDAGDLIASKNEPASLLGALGDKGEKLEGAETKAGLTFPVLDKPSLLFGMLLGQDVDLAVFDAGHLEISAGMQFGFPIGPLDLYIGGSASLTGHFRAGFDTYGIRKAFEYASDDDRSNDGVFNAAAGVLLGLYLDDFDADDNDVPEITFRAELTAGASIGVPLLKVGAEGGIGGQIDFDLHTEPAQQGKIRYSDIAAQLRKNPNPLCFFDASAKIDAFIRAYVESPFGKSVYPIANGVVWQQDDLFAFCQTPVEEQEQNLFGEVDADGVFHLAADADAQDYVIRQIEPDKILVESGGRQETYEAVTSITADLGGGADQLDLVRAPGYDGAGLPATLCGGAGPDRIATELGAATLYGDGGAACGKLAGAEPGPDVLTGGDAGDRLWGGPGDDVLTGGAGADELQGEAGNDVVRGGLGNDLIGGGDDNDTLDLSDLTGVTGVVVQLPGTVVASFQDGNGVRRTEKDTVKQSENVLGSAARDQITLTAAGSYRIDPGAGDDVVKPGPASAIVFGGVGDDTVVGGTVATQFLGGDGDDTMVNGPGFDTFLGQGGVDVADYSAMTVPLSLTVDGVADDGPSRNGLPDGSDNLVDVDTVRGGAAGDRIVGSSAPETLVGNGGRDVLEGGAGSDVLEGGADDDTLRGGDGADTMRGGDGKDTLDGGTGGDVFDGGTGLDTADYSGRTEGLEVRIDGVADDGEWRISESDDVTDTVERILGGSGADQLAGNNRVPTDEIFDGGAGGDRIEGYGGADVMDGGAGDDNLNDWDVNTQTTPQAKEGTAVDRMSGGPGTDFLYGNGGADILDGGTGRDTIAGGSGGDTITGGDDGDQLYGGDDADIIDGGKGDDGIQGGKGNDVITTGTGSCTVYGGTGNDTVTTATSLGDACSVFLGDTAGGKENDFGPNTFTGTGQGRDDVVGGDGPDTISLGDGGGVVSGNDGADTITMGIGEGSQTGNTISGDEGDDTITGGPGVDRIKGAAGNDHLWGGGGNDVLYGNGFDDDVATSERDDLHGGAGDDLLSGEGGDDVLDGGTGADDLYGGAGTDELTYADRTDGIVVKDDLNFQNGGTADLSVDGKRRDRIEDVETIIGGSGADVITFGAGSGRTGTLTLAGGGGADVLTVKPGTTVATVLDGGAGRDVITGGAGPDRMIGGTEDDTFVFLATVDGADTVVGGTGIDTVDYRARAKGSVTVSFNGVADDGATGEKDNVGADVEKALLGAATAAAATDQPAAGGPGAGGSPTGTAAGTPAPAVPGGPTPTTGPTPTVTPGPEGSDAAGSGPTPAGTAAPSAGSTPAGPPAG